MPRSIQEILDRADELACRSEEYEPAEGDERPVVEYLRQRAALARAGNERQLVDVVVAARSAGISWACVGNSLDVCPGGAAAVRRASRTGLIPDRRSDAMSGRGLPVRR
jgi:hypothetical protein